MFPAFGGGNRFDVTHGLANGFAAAANHCLQTAPPPGPVRPVAEFEPCSAVLIRYPLGIPVNLVSMLANEVEVICLVDNAYQQGRATDTFSAAGVNMDKVSFFVAPTDSYWTRDYSPWFIVDGNDDFAAVDFVYNRPRPADNQIPQLFAQNYSYPYYAMSLQQTGGNYMTDGISIAAQTTLVYNENRCGADGCAQHHAAIYGCPYLLWHP